MGRFGVFADLQVGARSLVRFRRLDGGVERSGLSSALSADVGDADPVRQRQQIPTIPTRRRRHCLDGRTSVERHHHLPPAMLPREILLAGSPDRPLHQPRLKGAKHAKHFMRWGGGCGAGGKVVAQLGHGVRDTPKSLDRHLSRAQRPSLLVGAQAKSSRFELPTCPGDERLLS